MNSPEKPLVKISLVIIAILIITVGLFMFSEIEKEENPENSISTEKDKPQEVSPASREKKAHLIQTEIKKDKSLPLPQSKQKKPEIKMGKSFIEKLKKQILALNGSHLESSLKRLISTTQTDPSIIALEFVKSNNKKLKWFGFNLMTGICIERPDVFKPNDFYKAYAKEGMSSSSYLSEIIEKTGDDFCREWACELSVDIYYHNSDPGDSRRKKLREFKKKEQNIYNFLKEILSDGEKVREWIDSNGKLSRVITEQWGRDNRYPLKMLAIISTLDMMNTENIPACSIRVGKIIDTYNFNYNILGRLNGKPTPLPPLPEEALLKKLSDAVFKDKYNDTYLWLPKGEGGFNSDELEIAVKEKDRKKMREMLSGFKRIIANILKVKLTIGLGNNEIELLRYFNQATWNGKPFNWDNKMIRINNNSSLDATLIITDKSVKTDPVTFLVPRRNGFVWFVPEGNFNIRQMEFSNLNFSQNNISIDKNNVILEINDTGK